MISPWEAFHKELREFLEGDPDYCVDPIEEAEDGLAFTITIDDEEKYKAFDRELNQRTLTFGNINVTINLEAGAEIEPRHSDAFNAIFRDNVHVKDVRERTDPAGTVWTYVQCYPEVLQVNTDNIGDYNGNTSYLAQDVLKKLFADRAGVFFCTADVRENDI